MAASNYDYADDLGPGTAYAEPTPGLGGLIKLLIIGLILLAIVAFGWVIWIAYDEGLRTGAVKTVPVIRADVGEVKRKPEEPGGLVVPHQDKLVFNRLAPGQADEPIERLLPLPEVPLTLPVTETTPPAEKSVGPSTAAPEAIVPAPERKLTEPAPVKEPPAVVAVAPPPPPPPPPEPTELAAKTPTPPPAPAKVEAKAVPLPAIAAKPAAVPAAAWRIQLVSLSSQQDAEAVWARMQKANTDLLGKLQLRVQTVKLSKGTFYRVQAGPLSDRTEAASLCSSLKTRKQDCLVVPPK